MTQGGFYQINAQIVNYPFSQKIRVLYNSIPMVTVADFLVEYTWTAFVECTYIEESEILEDPAFT